MKKTETVQVVNTYCDVCGAKCEGSWTAITFNGVEHHACNGWDEGTDEMHRDILQKRALDYAGSKRRIRQTLDDASGLQAVSLKA